MFRAHVLIVRMAKIVLYSLWYHHTYRCSKHVEAWNKLIIKFGASSWLILINKYIEMHGQQNVKINNSISVVEFCEEILQENAIKQHASLHKNLK